MKSPFCCAVGRILFALASLPTLPKVYLRVFFCCGLMLVSHKSSQSRRLFSCSHSYLPFPLMCSPHFYQFPHAFHTRVPFLVLRFVHMFWLLIHSTHIHSAIRFHKHHSSFHMSHSLTWKFPYMGESRIPQEWMVYRFSDVFIGKSHEEMDEKWRKLWKVDDAQLPEEVHQAGRKRENSMGIWWDLMGPGWIYGRECGFVWFLYGLVWFLYSFLCFFCLTYYIGLYGFWLNRDHHNGI